MQRRDRCQEGDRQTARGGLLLPRPRPDRKTRTRRRAVRSRRIRSGSIPPRPAPLPTAAASTPSSAISTARSPITTRRSGSIRRSRWPTTTAATPFQQGRPRPRAGRFRRRHQTQSVARDRLRQSRLSLLSASATWPMRSPTTPCRSSCSRTCWPISTAAMSTAIPNSSIAPPPITARRPGSRRPTRAAGATAA